MKIRTLLCGFVCGAVTMLFTTQVASMNGSDVGDQDLKKAFNEAAMTGDFHRKMTAIKGKHTHAVKWWRSPEAAADETEARGDTEWVLDGRFMIQRIDGKWLGMSFKGMVVLGYDNATEQYMSLWMDTLGTRMIFSKGNLDEAGEKITMQGEYVDVITRETVPVTTVFQLPARNRDMKIEVFGTDSGGEKFKILEVDSERRIIRGA